MKVYNKLPILAIIGFLLSNCQSGNESNTSSHNFIQPTAPIDPKIEGYNFPEDSTVIYQWLNTGNQDQIINHAWGIWASITPIITKKNELGQALRVFETWESPSELAERMRNGFTSQKPSSDALKRPKQFAYASLPEDIKVFETVDYSPTASRFPIKNQVFKKSVVESNKKSKLPEFPSNAITCKPTYKVIKKSSALSAIPIWPGTRSTPEVFDENKWGTYIFVDINNNGKGDGSISHDSLKATPNTIYNLSDFIYFEVDENSLNYMKTIDPGAQIGDYAILVAMHVGTKEIANWTWQSFWWTPDPSNPPFPSSIKIATKKPSAIKNAPAHYAMTLSYAIDKTEQIMRGSGEIPVIGFNPYLDAVFDSTVYKFPNRLNPYFKFRLNRTTCLITF